MLYSLHSHSHFVSSPPRILGLIKAYPELDEQYRHVLPYKDLFKHLVLSVHRDKIAKQAVLDVEAETVDANAAFQAVRDAKEAYMFHDMWK